MLCARALWQKLLTLHKKAADREQTLKAGRDLLVTAQDFLSLDSLDGVEIEEVKQKISVVPEVARLISELEGVGGSAVDLVKDLKDMQEKLHSWAETKLHPDFDNSLKQLSDHVAGQFVTSGDVKPVELYQGQPPTLPAQIDGWFLLRCFLAHMHAACHMVHNMPPESLAWPSRIYIV